MWLRQIFILPLILSASSIKVPVDNDDTATEVHTVVEEENKNTPLYYIKDDANVDSYLVPPDPHNPEVVPDDASGTPPTYLIPPLKEQQKVFYGEPSAQSDWLPILEMPAQNKRTSRFQKVPLGTMPLPQKPPLYSDLPQISLPVPIPATQLIPPAPDAVNEYLVPVIPENTRPELEKYNLPIQVPNYNFLLGQNPSKGPSDNLQFNNPVEPTLALHLIPPKPNKILKPSTQLYPKKYLGEFKPVPLPLSLYSDDKAQPVPKAKPALFFKPQSGTEGEHFLPVDDKKLYNFQKAQNIRKLKEEAIKQDAKTSAAGETHGDRTTNEQETSESNFRYPGHNSYPKALRQEAPPVSGQHGKNAAAAPAPDGRTEFRMHGMKGPHSYQFGFDTGKGKNRQFRYEERDNDGLVHGHYGYVDKSGKLRVVNYSAHPEYGFRAEPVEKE